MERAMEYAQKVARMIQEETIRRPDREENFVRLRTVIRELFPRVHAACRHWELEGSLLYCWPGEQEGPGLLLMSHQDVVEALGQWKYPPFSGTIAEGKLWGRGALDVKGNLFGIFQAVEELIAQGYAPARSVWIASSDCEEVGGNDLVVDFLRQQGAEIGLLIDEGPAIQNASLPEVPGLWAQVALAEKGYADVRCIARSAGGHASSPEKGSPLPRLGAFMCRVEEKELFPPALDQASREMYRRLAQAAPAGLAEKLLAVAEEAEGWENLLTEGQRNALRTTVAFTMASGSGAANVMPQEAWVVCNIRIAPGQTVESVLEVLGREAAELGITLEVLRSNQPSPITDVNSSAFRQVERALAATYPEVKALPMLLSGGTDTKHFVSYVPNCVRFTPMKITTQQQKAVHGVDENIDVDALAGDVDFFKYLICDYGKEQE